jgi:hypothetical protein
MEATQLPPLNDVNFNLFFNRVATIFFSKLIQRNTKKLFSGHENRSWGLNGKNSKSRFLQAALRTPNF